MPFDREAAKAAGYSDAEIDAHLSGQPAPPQPAEPEGGGLPGWAVPAAAAATGVAGVALAAKPAGRVVNQISREPGALGTLARGARAFLGRPPEAPMQGAPAPAASPVAAPAPAAPKPNASLVMLDADDIAAHPEFRNYREGQTVSRKLYERVKSPELFAPGSAASRAARPAPAQPSATSVSMSGAVEAPTVPNSVQVTKGRAKPARIGGVIGGGKAAGSAESRTAPAPPAALDAPDESVDLSKVPKWRGGKMSEGGARHDGGYFSQSKAAEIHIEDMPQPHLRSAWEKLGAELKANKRLAPVKEGAFNRMTAELKHRAQANMDDGASLNMYDRPKAGSAAGRAARVAQAASEVAAAEQGAMGSAARRVAGGGLGSTALGIAGYIPNLMNPGQDFDDSDAQFAEMNRKRLGLPPDNYPAGF